MNEWLQAARASKPDSRLLHAHDNSANSDKSPFVTFVSALGRRFDETEGAFVTIVTIVTGVGIF